MGQESRRQHRIAVALEVRVRGEDPNGVPFEESTHSSDVSRGGCSFETERAIPEGASLEIEILRRPLGRREQPPFITTASVVRSSASNEGRHVVGVQFTGPQFPTFSGEDSTATL